MGKTRAVVYLSLFRKVFLLEVCPWKEKQEENTQDTELETQKKVPSAIKNIVV